MHTVAVAAAAADIGIVALGGTVEGSSSACRQLRKHWEIEIDFFHFLSLVFIDTKKQIVI